MLRVAIVGLQIAVLNRLEIRHPGGKAVEVSSAVGFKPIRIRTCADSRQLVCKRNIMVLPGILDRAHNAGRCIQILKVAGTADDRRVFCTGIGEQAVGRSGIAQILGVFVIAGTHSGHGDCKRCTGLQLNTVTASCSIRIHKTGVCGAQIIQNEFQRADAPKYAHGSIVYNIAVRFPRNFLLVRVTAPKIGIVLCIDLSRPVLQIDLEHRVIGTRIRQDTGDVRG